MNLSMTTEMTDRRIPEILAPAGGREQFFAALNSGADAVFLGLKEFNARARAENFTIEDLQELVPVAQKFGMKVLVTLNVLIKDLELAPLIQTLGKLEALGIHAIIVQDLGLARIVNQHFPALRMHASTQMAVHNLAGVIEAWKAGFKRVVLARELTALEIKKICASVPPESVEIEAFCHGSLCYSYSGLCFFSGAQDARSGNRGECAYTCRKPYKILNEPGHGFLFSMKDLDTSDDLDMLVGAGVDTLKIEGRKKDAQFVSTVVTLYRRKLDEIFQRSTLRANAPAEARDTLAQATDMEKDKPFSFHRERTTFFLKGRYHENVIDLDNPTHKGMRVGEVIKILGRSMRVFTEIPIERFDGIRVDPSEQIFHAKPQHGQETRSNVRQVIQKYENGVCQFSLRDLVVLRTSVPFATEGTWVDIEVPTECDMPRVGDIVFKTRSNDLKRRVQKISVPPRDTRLKRLLPLSIAIDLTAQEEILTIQAQAFFCGELVKTSQVCMPAALPKSTSTLATDLAESFSLLGDVGVWAPELEITGETHWFVPRSKIKELKQGLQQELIDAIHKVTETRMSAATKSLVTERRDLRGTATALRFQIKIDRLEYLDAISTFLEQTPDFPLTEIVFEPKRAFLPSLRIEETANKLVTFCQQHQILLRAAFPTVIRAWDEPLLRRWIAELAKAGVNAYEIGNVGAFTLLENWGLKNETTNLASDFTLYALNSQAASFWEEKGVNLVSLSIEDDFKNLSVQLSRWTNSRDVKPQFPVFKDTPLFIAESCSLTALHNGCPGSEVCGYRTLEIENAEGERFFVAHENCKSVVYGKDAFSVSQRLPQLRALGVEDFRIDFLTRHYSPEDLHKVLHAMVTQLPIAGTHIANFDRELL